MEPVFTDLSISDIPPEANLDIAFNVRVFVTGSTPLPRERSLRARFDDDRVSRVRINGFGTGFTGYMPARPAEGAHLIVEFDGQEPIDTGLVYHEEDAPIA